MLKKRLYRFLYETPETKHLARPQQLELLQAILLYILGRRNADDLRELSRRHNITEPLYHFKYDTLDRSYYTISQFWRVAMHYFKIVGGRRYRNSADGPANTCIKPVVVQQAIALVPTLSTPQEKSQCADDMTLFEFLSIEDHRQLCRFARAYTFETPTDVDLLPVIKRLQTFCKWLAYRKMRFLVNHDPSLSIEGLTHELFEAALVTLRNYDADGNTERLYNYAKSGAEHHCANRLDYYTTRSRTRLAVVTVQGQKEFVPTTVSIDNSIDGDANVTMLDIMGDPSSDPDKEFSERQWLCGLLSRIPGNAERVVNIVMGNRDDEFDAWLQANNFEVGTLSDGALARRACEFVGLPIKKLRSILQQDGVRLAS